MGPVGKYGLSPVHYCEEGHPRPQSDGPGDASGFRAMRKDSRVCKAGPARWHLSGHGPGTCLDLPHLIGLELWGAVVVNEANSSHKLGMEGKCSQSQGLLSPAPLHNPPCSAPWSWGIPTQEWDSQPLRWPYQPLSQCPWERRSVVSSV
jgi:hypothetical protein